MEFTFLLEEKITNKDIKCQVGNNSMKKKNDVDELNIMEDLVLLLFIK